MQGHVIKRYDRESSCKHQRMASMFSHGAARVWSSLGHVVDTRGHRGGSRPGWTQGGVLSVCWYLASAAGPYCPFSSVNRRCCSMFSHVLPCSPMFFHVLPCSPMFLYVFECSSMFFCVLPCTPMFFYVLLCSSMFSYVLLCSPMFFHVLLCSSMFFCVFECSPMFSYVTHFGSEPAPFFCFFPPSSQTDRTTERSDPSLSNGAFLATRPI